MNAKPRSSSEYVVEELCLDPACEHESRRRSSDWHPFDLESLRSDGAKANKGRGAEYSLTLRVRRRQPSDPVAHEPLGLALDPGEILLLQRIVKDVPEDVPESAIDPCYASLHKKLASLVKRASKQDPSFATMARRQATEDP